jgi:hypothetical protein
MKKKLILLILGLGIATSYAQDLIVFKNGDLLSGKILSQNEEHVQFVSDTLGSLTLSTPSIAELRPEIPTEALEKPTELIQTNTIEPTEIAQSTESDVEPLSLSIDEKDVPKKKRWSGQAGLSVALRESNTLRRSGDHFDERNQEFESYRAYGNVKWEGEKNNLLWDWTYRYSRTDLRKNDDFFKIAQTYKYDFSGKLFAGTKTIYQRDYRRGIDSEYLQTAEVGITWIDSPKLKFSTAAGAGYHQYNREQRQYSDSEGKFVLDQSLRWQMIDSLALFQKYTHLGNLDKYHFIFTSGLENKLIRDVFLRFEYRLDRDTDVDYDDNSYYDKALLTSLLYKF